jgi:signal transduction histidine kinase
VKGFVEAHSGSVNVSNIMDGGARFSILIPSDKPDMREEI